MPVITFYAGLRKTAGTRETVIDGSTLAEVLLALNQSLPVVGKAILDGERLRPYIIITINGHNIDPAHGLVIPVRADDHIAIFPPIAGGCALTPTPLLKGQDEE